MSTPSNILPNPESIYKINSSPSSKKLVVKKIEEDDDEEIPEWYWDTYEHDLASHSIPSKKHKSIRRLSLPTIKTNPTCEDARVSVEDALLEIQDCQNLARISLKLEGDGIKDPSEVDLVKKWVCRPEPRKVQPRQGNMIGEVLIRRIAMKCKEAMELLMYKMDKGLLPKSWEQGCNPTYQHGIDETPTPSTCGIQRVPSSMMDIDRARSHHKITEKLVKEISQYLIHVDKSEQDRMLADGDMLYCPLLDANIEEYLKEPTAEYLLKQAGALDENGYLLCTYSNFYQVEHTVKSLLVDMAKKCMDNYMKVPNVANQKKISLSRLTEAYESRMERREQIAQVLQEEMSEPFLKIKETRPHTKIYRGSVPIEVPRRGQHSMAQEKYAEEIAGKILTFIDRRSLFEDDDEDMVEIMPFQNRDSFETDGNRVSLVHNDHPENERHSKILHLDSPIRAEFKSWTLKHKSDLCFSGLDYATPRTWREWENLTKLNDLTKNGTTNRKDKRYFIQLKYYRHWVEITRKRKAIKSYSSNDGQDLPSQMWRGPFPSYVIANVRALGGKLDFQPASSKSFYKGVRLVEANMFESARQVLKDFVEEEEKVVSNLPTSVVFPEPVNNFDLEDEYEEEEEREEEEGEEEEEEEEQVMDIYIDPVIVI